MKLTGEWKKLGPSVYESKYGDRVHTGGMIKMASGHRISLGYIPADIAMSKFITMAGNRKRGMMLFTDIAEPTLIMKLEQWRELEEAKLQA